MEIKMAETSFVTKIAWANAVTVSAASRMLGSYNTGLGTRLDCHFAMKRSYIMTQDDVILMNIKQILSKTEEFLRIIRGIIGAFLGKFSKE